MLKCEHALMKETKGISINVDENISWIISSVPTIQIVRAQVYKTDRNEQKMALNGLADTEAKILSATTPFD